MNFSELLEAQTTVLVDSATENLRKSHCERYEAMGPDECRLRLQELFKVTVLSVKKKDLLPMIAFLEAKAEERFSQGFQIREVQIAVNCLEEALWSFILKELPLEQQAEAFGLLSTVLGAGKDALARRYVSLATNRQAPSLDLHALFKGTDGRYNH